MALMAPSPLSVTPSRREKRARGGRNVFVCLFVQVNGVPFSLVDSCVICVCVSGIGVRPVSICLLSLPLRGDQSSASTPVPVQECKCTTVWIDRSL